MIIAGGSRTSIKQTYVFAEATLMSKLIRDEDSAATLPLDLKSAGSKKSKTSSLTIGRY